MLRNSVVNIITTKLQHWKETARQKQEMKISGVALAKDMGISYETLMFEGQRPHQNDRILTPVSKQLKPVVNIRSKLFHKIRTIH